MTTRTKMKVVLFFLPPTSVCICLRMRKRLVSHRWSYLSISSKSEGDFTHLLFLLCTFFEEWVKKPHHHLLLYSMFSPRFHFVVQSSPHPFILSSPSFFLLSSSLTLLPWCSFTLSHRFPIFLCLSLFLLESKSRKRTRKRTQKASGRWE